MTAITTKMAAEAPPIVTAGTHNPTQIHLFHIRYIYINSL